MNILINHKLHIIHTIFTLPPFKGVAKGLTKVILTFDPSSNFISANDISQVEEMSLKVRYEQK